MGHPRLKLVYTRRKPARIKYGSSRAQRAAYQVNWTVYVAEGLAANLRHSLDFQSHEMTGSQRQKLRAAIATADRIVAMLRENIGA